MILTVENLRKNYGRHTAVREISFQIESDQCVALLGPNGSGKTTTINMLAGLLAPTSGKVLFMGEEKVDRRNVGYLPQYPAFFPWMTALEYMQFAGKLSGVEKRSLRKKSESMLEFTRLGDVMNKRIGGFSGGMKQRLGLAQALLHDPKLLLLDEPVSALDPSGRKDVLYMMQELKERMAILFSTHILHDAEQVCDRVLLMKDGELRWAGPLEGLVNSQDQGTFVLTAADPLPGGLLEKEYMKEARLLTPEKGEFALRRADDRNRLLRDCLEHGVVIDRFEKKNESLEEAYMEVMSR